LAKWTEKQKQKILALAESSTIREAAKKSGVPEGTIKRWRSEERQRNQRTEPNRKKVKRTEPKKNLSEKKESKHMKEEDSYNLTEKQRLFAEIYVRNFNATQAAIKAGYSPVSAFVIGCENLRKPNVREYINHLKQLKKESIMLGEDDIVERYMRIAFADMTDFSDFGMEEIPMVVDGQLVRDKDGEIIYQPVNVLRFKSSSHVDGGLICEIKTSRQGASIKLEDRQKALDWLAKYFEMNPEHKHKKAHDEKKLQLERERFEHTKEMDRMKVF